MWDTRRATGGHPADWTGCVGAAWSLLKQLRSLTLDLRDTRIGVYATGHLGTAQQLLPRLESLTSDLQGNGAHEGWSFMAVAGARGSTVYRQRGETCRHRVEEPSSGSFARDCVRRPLSSRKGRPRWAAVLVVNFAPLRRR
eukprot:TRINITY_DN3517_c0_g1_i1.p1 TRINITY_DN3517_c0_g1~~TRINITY_DN3517_c0_g1_i1.p1  ORF type:complete len:141 (-),score=8.78 TRINITY_DN3517_c0_g1_i1:174-596(-)